MSHVSFNNARTLIWNSFWHY